MWKKALSSQMPSFIPVVLSDMWNPKPIPGRLNASLSSLYTLDHQALYSELGVSTRPLTLTLSGHTFTFWEGRWQLLNRDQEVSPEAEERGRVARLKKRNQELREEMNTLRLRVEVLMDMMTEATAQLRELAPGKE